MRNRKIIGFFFSFTLIISGLVVIPASLTAQTSTGPVRARNFRAFNQTLLQGEAAVVMDAASGQILYKYHADWQWPLASITKLMSSIVYTEQQPNWNTVVAMSSADEVGGGRLRVDVGTELSKRDLLYCALVGSANNTAMAMMRTSSLTQDQFVARMNAVAKEINLTNTRFVEPSGMQPTNISNALDIANLARYAFSIPTIQRAAQTSQYRFELKTGEVKIIKNTDKLLTSDNSVYVVGGKTGYLEESQNNFVVQLRPTKVNGTNKGELIVVVLGSTTKDQSFNSAKRLAQWAWSNHMWPKSLNSALQSSVKQKASLPQG